MRLKNAFANLLTIATGAIVGFISFLLFLLFTHSWFGMYEYDVPNYCWRFLLWPGFLMGRIGLTHTWIAVLILGVVGFILAFKYLRHSGSRIRQFIYASVLVLLYEFMGFSYFYWLPVPKPAFSLSSPVNTDWDTYIGAYELGYRCGIVDIMVSYHWWSIDPEENQAITEGFLWGYEHGISEWESIFPGLLESEAREIFDRFSKVEINTTKNLDTEIREGISVRELEQCRIEFKELGRRLNFSGQAIYKATVNTEGVLIDLKSDKIADSLGVAVRMDEFESCVNSWRFGEAGEYTIIFSAGTSGELLSKGWTIQITNGNKSMIVRLK